MSGIGGVYNFDRAPIDDEMLEAIGQGLARIGPDGGGHFRSGCVAMAYRAFHTNCESRREAQPLISSRGDILCWDGRLDNREELIARLSDALRGDHTDVAIVMAAYLKWGIDSLPRIIGDFALSLWDSVTDSLILARDLIGPRTLYYHRNERRIIWSTDLTSLLELAGAPLEVNDEYVAGFLTDFPEPGQTPYKNFCAVPPAHAVIIRTGQVQLRRFWTLDPDREIRYHTDVEYEEHFRHLFAEAVRCRLRATGSIWAELSGGMDSSPIVCMANQIIKRGETQALNLETVSRVFDEADKSDERKYILPVEERIGKKGLHLREDDHRILAPWSSDYSPTIPSFAANFWAYYRAVNDAMHRTGARVLLSGLGGDEVLSGDGEPCPELADLLLQGKLIRFHRRARVWQQALKQDYLRFVWKKVIVPLLPPRLQIARNRNLDRILRFYNPDFSKRMNLRKRLFGPSDVFGFRRPSGRDQAAKFLWAPRHLSCGFWQELCDFEFSYPFTHRPLVEFMMAIPMDQKARPGESKSIVKRALRDLLPSELLNRKRGRISIQAAMQFAARREKVRIHHMFENALACTRGYLNAEAILTAYDESQNNPDPLVISFVPFEHWLQSVERRRVASAYGLYLEQAPVRTLAERKTAFG